PRADAHSSLRRRARHSSAAHRMSKRQGKYTAPARITRARWRTPSQDSELALAATTAGGRIELVNVGLVVGGGILAGRSTVLAVAPTLVVALDEAARALDHAEVVVGVLPVGFRCDAIARGRRFAGQRLVFVEHLMGVAAHPHVRPAAIEDLVSIGRTIGIVI